MVVQISTPEGDIGVIDPMRVDAGDIQHHEREEDMVGSSASRPRRVDEVTVAHAMMEHMNRVQNAEDNSRVPQLTKPPHPGNSQLFIRDFGMYTKEGNQEVSNLVRYVEDMMRRRVDDSIIRDTLNRGFKLIAKKGHEEIYDTWVVRDIEDLLDSVVDDLIIDVNDPLNRLLTDPVGIDVPTEAELRPFRSAVPTLRNEEELYQLPVP